MATAVAPWVERYFEEYPDEESTPGAVTRYVEEKRGLGDMGQKQSAGAVRAAIIALQERGRVERLMGSPLRYKGVPKGSAPKTYPPKKLGTVTSPGIGSGGGTMPKSTPSPGTASTPAPPRVPLEKFHRPSGEQYFPRSIGDFRDVDVLRKAREAGLFVLLYGPPGGGKTALVEASFPDLITMAGDSDTGVPDFTGDFVRIPENKDDDDAWADGPLVKAMLWNDGEGCPLFIDDATLISPGVMSVVYPAMDGRRKISVKSRPPKLGRDIVAGPKFYVIAAHNPGVPGAILSEALSSRFTIQIEVTTDYDLAHSQGVNPKAVKVARNLDTVRQNKKGSWAPQMRELLAFKRNQAQFDETFACAALIAAAPEGEDRTATERAIATTFGAGFKLKALSLGGQV